MMTTMKRIEIPPQPVDDVAAIITIMLQQWYAHRVVGRGFSWSVLDFWILFRFAAGETELFLKFKNEVHRCHIHLLILYVMHSRVAQVRVQNWWQIDIFSQLTKWSGSIPINSSISLAACTTHYEKDRSTCETRIGNGWLALMARRRLWHS